MASAETQKPSGRRRREQISRSENDFIPNNVTESHPNRPTRQLDFYQAMSDFKTMFPTMDPEVIEAVLRANDGAVDATIDQLLTMGIDADETVSPKQHITTFEGFCPKYEEKASDDSPPSYSEAIRSTTQQQQSIWTTPLSSHTKSFASATPRRNILDLEVDELSLSNTEPKRPLTSINSASSITHTKKHYRNWNPPMLGNLPDDFLRITPTKFAHGRSKSPTRRSTVTSGFGSRSKDRSPGFMGGVERAQSFHSTSDKTPLRSNSERNPRSRHSIAGSHSKSVVISTHEFSPDVLQEKMKENERRRKRASMEWDPDFAQYLEDERLALVMQNSEFLQELRGNEDFMKTLEKDRMNASAFEPATDNRHVLEPQEEGEGYGKDNQDTLEAFPFSQSIPKDKDEDAELRRQLNQMGRASRKQFAALARKFFSRRKKKSSKQILKEQMAPSMMNLLDDEEENEDTEDKFDGESYNDRPQFDPLPGTLETVPSHRTVQRPAYKPETVVTHINEGRDMV